MCPRLCPRIYLINCLTYSCAFWPQANVLCDNSTFYVEPCKAPKTVDVELLTCDHKMNRDLHAQSHMLAWFGICSFALLGVFVFVMKKALSRHGYLQTMWISEYRKVSKFWTESELCTTDFLYLIY